MRCGGWVISPPYLLIQQKNVTCPRGDSLVPLQQYKTGTAQSFAITGLELRLSQCPSKIAQKTLYLQLTKSLNCWVYISLFFLRIIYSKKNRTSGTKSLQPRYLLAFSCPSLHRNRWDTAGTLGHHKSLVLCSRFTYLNAVLPPSQRVVLLGPCMQ